MPRKKRKTKEKLPFWKKIKNPELKHLAEHIGKITDNTSWKELLDVALALTCAGAGWLAAENLGVKDLKVKAGMALSGAIAYRLATSGNIIAGASGTALLGAYGLIDVWNPLYQGVKSMLPPFVRGTTFEEFEAWAAAAKYGWGSKEHLEEAKETWTFKRVWLWNMANPFIP